MASKGRLFVMTALPPPEKIETLKIVQEKDPLPNPSKKNNLSDPTPSTPI